MPADHLQARIRARLAALDAEGLLRVLHPPAGIDLSSNDYLGLAVHPRIVARFREAIARHGCGSTGSRLLRGEREVFARIEERFARFKGASRAIYFATGYMANLAVLTALPEAGDVIFSDQANHASLIDGIRLSRAARAVYPHNDPAALERLLRDTPCAGIRFVVVESVFSMDGDMAPLADYANLCRAYEAVLIVDEAHAVGIYGASGSGLIEEAGLAADRCVSINTAGKALGVAGAFVAGPEWVVDYLRQRARTFVFSTAPPPAVAEALEESLAVIRDEPGRRAHLRRLADVLRLRLHAPRGAHGSQIVPIAVGDNERAVQMAGRLQSLGFDVRAIRPPSVPGGTARLRVSVNASLSEDVLDRFVEALTRVRQEVGVCSVVSS